MSIRKSQETRTQYLASLRKEVQDLANNKGSNKNQKQNDDRYWKPEVDKTGQASAIIRFLPALPGSAFPYVAFYNHGFQDKGTGKWFIEDCPSTLGGLPSDVCPACADVNRLYTADNLDIKHSPAKQLGSQRKRKLKYHSNILVVSDPKHPENNGKVFLYKYGKKIHDKLMGMINPEFADIQPLDPFDVDCGANFRLRQTKEDGWPNFDKSSFDGPSVIGDDDFIEAVEKQMYDLNKILDPKNFKSYEKLAEHYLKVTGTSSPSAETTNIGGTSATSQPSVEDGMNDEAPAVAPKTAAAKTAAPRASGKTAKPKTEAAPTADQTDDDDFFTKLAAQSANDD